MEPKIVVQNVIATARLGHGIDLDAVAKTFPNVKYDPKSFPGLLFRLRRRPTKVLVFRNGKMVCIGAKSEREALYAVRKVVRKLRGAGIISEADTRLHSPQHSGDRRPTRAHRSTSRKQSTSSRAREGVMYEPEQFPGLIYRMEEPKTTFLIFHSGKLVCVGAKTEEDLHKAVKKLQRILQEKDLLCIHDS